MAGGWLGERARLEALARAIEPSVRVQTKDGAHWRALAWLAAVATGGGISRRTFLRTTRPRSGRCTAIRPAHYG